MNDKKEQIQDMEEVVKSYDPKKHMLDQMKDDAWKAAQKASASSSKTWNKQPSGTREFGAEDFKDTDPNKNEMSTAGSVVGAHVPPEELSEEELMNMVRELVRHRVKEVVRKKPGGGGYTLYAPNKGKKGKSKALGTFPTKLGAKRAELARFPPKDPEKLKRLRRQVDKMARDPKKAAEKEKKAKKMKAFSEGIFDSGVQDAKSLTKTDMQRAAQDALKLDPKSAAGLFTGMVKKTSGDKTKSSDLAGTFLKNKQLMGKIKKDPSTADATADLTKSIVGIKEQNDRKTQFYERRILSTIIKKSLNESIFNEEQKKESEWDDYIDKLSKTALAGDDKFRRLQKAIESKVDSVLESAFNMIKKAVGKDVKLKNFGVKKDSETGKNYLAFGASFQDTTAEPIYIHIENGVPQIVLSSNAKIVLTKTDPKSAKLFRAELVTVQERSLDSMDDLVNAIQARDKYLSKLENDVDAYVAGLSPLQVSLLKQLLVKKYRKMT